MRKVKKTNRKIGRGYKGQYTDEMQMASDYKKLLNHCPRGYASKLENGWLQIKLYFSPA